jgi:N-methylhydantoinase B/oxoprolinase/acetone carboxylase alpha subunit
MSVDRMGLDPAALSVLIARLSGIAEEMGAVLRRGAYSPNIKERADCSAAVFDAQGAMLAQAEHIPVHLGSMPASVAAVIEALGELGPGEQAVVNDPFAGGTHLNDITVVAPCWQRGRLVGWVANRAHHADVGGAAPGSLPADATDVHQEGLRIPPTRLTDDVRRLILANSRTPAERAGDLDAQLGANVVGIARLAALAAPPSGDAAPFEEVVAYGERRCRAALGALADGEWSAEDQMDSTGSADEQQRPARLRCTVRVRGERIEFDFTGTDAQRPGNTNAVRAVTESAVAFAVRSVIDPGLPATAGTMAPVSIITEPGTLVDARYPAAVGAGNVEVSQRVVDVVCRALAAALPDRVGAASQGTMNNVLIGGDGPGGHWVYYETVAGGQGGRPPRPGVPGAAPMAGMSGVHTGMTNTDQVDYRSGEPRPGQSGIHTAMTNTDQVDYRSGEPRPGQSGIHTAMTNTRNTPIEALEREFPLRVLRYRLRRGSGGAGWSAGGEGIERDLQVLEDATVSLITERRVSQPWGLAGGEPGAVGENWLLPGGDEARAERLPDKCTIRLKAGDVLRMLTPGGGGWGAAGAIRSDRQGSSPLRSA